MSWSKPISDWSRATFGAATPQRALERAHEELAELLEAQSAEEAADVVICLCGFAAAAGFDLAAETGSDCGHYWPSYDSPQKALDEVDNQFCRLLHNPIPFRAGRVVQELHAFAAAAGFGLMQAVEAKMAINRQRKWKLNGDGTGQHE